MWKFDAVLDEVGELLSRGPNVVKGYWNRPADTAAGGAGDLCAFLGGRIAAVKISVRFWFRGGRLPRDPGGKILKTRLRAELLDPPQ